jgi:pyridoxamine 5'-phosphate oxidase
LADTNQLKFVTDTRSDKIEQIQQQPWAEACWYFPKTREQFRLTGHLTLVTSDESHPHLQPARITMWQELSDPARLQFAWPHPGKPRGEKTTFEPPPPDPHQPVDNFCLLLLDPCQVDHLELRGEPQNRWLYSRDENQQWSRQAINP